jgi:hypothetical protein
MNSPFHHKKREIRGRETRIVGPLLERTNHIGQQLWVDGARSRGAPAVPDAVLESSRRLLPPTPTLQTIPPVATNVVVVISVIIILPPKSDEFPLPPQGGEDPRAGDSYVGHL